MKNPQPQPPASRAWITSDSPENHVEDRKCPKCHGRGGRGLDNGIFGPGSWQACWDCGGSGWRFGYEPDRTEP